MTATFWFKTNTLKTIQRLVGAADARFQGNPIIMGGGAYVSLCFDRAPDNYKRFRALAAITQQPFFSR
ncbi:hypothetical protein THIOKS11720020 [Thiocapsa sp. KS1]|nr:hypothetical protein THIOKS11720020 [Thiocapsa sp. KS1]